MAYMPPWERLSDALTRVMEASGLTQSDAQADICRAIADRAVRVQAKVGRHTLRRITSGDTLLEGRELLVPTSLKPEDLDWQASRPLEAWMVPHGTPVFHGPWDLDWIKLFTTDVSNVLCGASKEGSPAAQTAPGKVGAKNRSRPAFERAQRAFKALYPDGAPTQADVPNKILCGKIAQWLSKNGLGSVSDDSILRAAGRRK